MLQNPFYKRMQGEAEVVLECHLKKAHHLKHLNDIGGQHVRAPNLDPKRGPIPGRKDLTVQRLDLTGDHDLSILYGSPQIFRAARIPNLVNFCPCPYPKGKEAPPRQPGEPQKPNYRSPCQSALN